MKVSAIELTGKNRKTVRIQTGTERGTIEAIIGTQRVALFTYGEVTGHRGNDHISAKQKLTAVAAMLGEADDAQPLFDAFDSVSAY